MWRKDKSDWRITKIRIRYAKTFMAMWISRDFLAFYVKDHRILAVAGMNRDRDIAVWEELIRLNRVPSPDRLSGDPAIAWNL